MKDILDIFVLIVYLAIFAVAVKNKGTGEVVDKVGTVFTNSIKVAKS